MACSKRGKAGDDGRKKKRSIHNLPFYPLRFLQLQQMQEWMLSLPTYNAIKENVCYILSIIKGSYEPSREYEML